MQGVTCTFLPSKEIPPGGEEVRGWEPARYLSPSICPGQQPPLHPLREEQIFNDCPVPTVLHTEGAASSNAFCPACDGGVCPQLRRSPGGPRSAPLLIPSWVPHSVLPWLFAGRSRRGPPQQVTPAPSPVLGSLGGSLLRNKAEIVPGTGPIRG